MRERNRTPKEPKFFRKKKRKKQKKVTKVFLIIIRLQNENKKYAPKMDAIDLFFFWLQKEMMKDFDCDGVTNKVTRNMTFFSLFFSSCSLGLEFFGPLSLC